MTSVILPVEWAQTPAPSESNYFDQLAAARPIAAVIAQELEPLTAAGAKGLRQCGRFPIGGGRIELVNGPRGLFARGAKWCGSRYCPHCHPRIMGALGSKRAYRARAAADAGFGIAFMQAGQPRSDVGELFDSVADQLTDWRTAYPSPSRAPVDFQRALPGWIGADYNVEVDYDADAQNWHVHAHALAFKAAAFTPEQVAALASFWRHPVPLAWADVAHTPEAAARYSVKAENEDPNILSVFDLAALGMVDQVAEYLRAVQGRRLRQPSAKLTQLLKLSGSGEDDAALMALAEAAPGEVIGQFTQREWCSKW